MRDFCLLYQAIDQTTKTNEKVEVMQHYFARAKPADAAWAVYFLSGQKLKRLINTAKLRIWASEEANIPLWLLEETYEWVGDLGETLAAVIADSDADVQGSLCDWVEEKLLPLASMSDHEQQAAVKNYWKQMTSVQRFVLNKLITGSFRIGVSQRLLTRAIASVAKLSVESVAHRLMGNWSPTPQFYSDLIDPTKQSVANYLPYPFCLANPIESSVEQLGQSDDYLVEWKWDGIRAQVIKRDDELYIWSRGEERIEDRFPELVNLREDLPNGTVLDGEILAFKDGRPLAFAELQRRIGRKTIGKKLMADVPVEFVAFDCLEYDGEDIRQHPLSQRRERLQTIVEQASQAAIQVSPTIVASNWDGLEAMRQQCRQYEAEGLMLKPYSSTYAVGRTRGAWWKWKIDPYTIDAVLTAAQRGHGRRASMYTDYTFSLWDNGRLVTFAKAYSGLTDSEMRQVDQFVRQNTLDRFGPVRTVEPLLVMELAFENLQASKRHKSGVAVRFPRILRWRHDKKPEQANTLDELRRLAT